MNLTGRSRTLAALLPPARAGVRAGHLRSAHADDALQQTLIALIPHLGRLSAMTESQRSAYVFVTASRKAMAFRKRLGLHAALGSDEEVATWFARESPPTQKSPETEMRVAQAVRRAEAAFDQLGWKDRERLHVMADIGASERKEADQLGLSRGSIAHRLRRARSVLAHAWSSSTSRRRTAR